MRVDPHEMGSGVPLSSRDESGAGTRIGVFGTVLLIMLAVYLSTATYQRPWHIDALTNAITGWSIGYAGTPLLPDHEEATRPGQKGNVAWIVESPKGPVSQYPPGAALTVAPIYGLFRIPADWTTIRGSNRPELSAVSMPLPTLVPAAVAAATLSALAVAFAASAFWELAGRDPAFRRQSILGGVAAGLATGQWSVSSNQLWQHGPATALVAGGVLLSIRRRYWMAGMAFGGAILVRPHLAVLAALIGAGLLVQTRSLRPAVSIGIPSVGGLVALLIFNHWIWGTVTVSGGYGTTFADGFVNNDALWYVENVLGALIDVRHGLLPSSPFLIFLLPGLRKAWRVAQPAVRWGALGGVAYLLIQLRANRFSGGDGHFGYRYPLEALAAAAPLLMLSYRSWVVGRPLAERYFGFAVVASAIPQAIWAVMT